MIRFPCHKSVRIEFFDRHNDLEIQIDANIGDTKAALADHLSHQILSREDRKRLQLVRFRRHMTEIITTAGADAHALTAFKLVHTSRTQFINIHTIPLYPIIYFNLSRYRSTHSQTTYSGFMEARMNPASVAS